MPDMALVLLCTVPSGECEVVSVRNELSSRLRPLRPANSRSLRPSVIHADRAVGQDASRLLYVGGGRNDPQSRPSVFYNPFFFIEANEAVANDRFEEWLSVRADLSIFLRPLFGMALLCDCRRGLGCHVNTLLRVLDHHYPPPGLSSPHFGHVSHAVDIVSRST